MAEVKIPRNATPHKPRSRKHELHTDDIKIEQREEVVQTGDPESLSDGPVKIDPVTHPNLSKSYLDALAFNQEPVTVMFTPGQERFSAPFVDGYIAGVGIEVLSDDGTWLKIEQVPVNVEVTTKRMYVEIFARAKHTDVRAYSSGVQANGTDPQNFFKESTMLKYPFVVIDDPRGAQGAEWLRKIISGRA